MCPDNDIYRPIGHARFGFISLFGRNETRQRPDIERPARKALGERVIMLASEQSRRGDDRHLVAAHRRDEGSPQRHFCFPEADIAANQTVHRLAR